jgi:hypothetical protein
MDIIHFAREKQRHLVEHAMLKSPKEIWDNDVTLKSCD